MKQYMIIAENSTCFGFICTGATRFESKLKSGYYIHTTHDDATIARYVHENMAALFTSELDGETVVVQGLPELPPPPKSADWNAGAAAAHVGRPRSANPFDQGVPERDEWNDGFDSVVQP